MAKNNFSENCIIPIDGTNYDYRGHVDGRLQLIDPATGQCFAAPDALGVVRPIDDAQFEDLMLAGRARIIRRPSADPIRHLNDVAQWAIAQAMAIDPEVSKRLAQCDMLDEAGVPNGRKAIGNYLRKHWVGKLKELHGDHDSPASIEGWRRTRGHAGSRHAGQMVRMNGKTPRGPYCADVPAELLQKHALARNGSRIMISSGFAAYCAELGSVNEGRHPTYAQPDEPYTPASYRTFNRRCHALEQSATVRARSGAQAVMQDWMGAGRSLTADFAMQRVIIDHTWLDVVVVHRRRDGTLVVLGRPWLTLAPDVASRGILSHVVSFIDPCVWTVGQAVWRMAMPKRVPADMAERYPMLRQMRGRPVEIVVDNAPEFRSHAFEAAARSAGFSVRFCPIKSPRYRGVGERAIGTINRLICDDLPGKTIPIEEARRIGYDASKVAVVTMDQLEAIVARAVAIYNTEPHDGIGNRQPALMFQRDAARHGINNFVDLEAFRRDLMPVEQKVQLSNTGIVAFSGLRFHDHGAVPALLDDLRPIEPRRQRRNGATATVDFRYDPMDISRIHVWNRRRRTYVELRCTDESYSDGMPLFVHEAIRDQTRREGEAFNTPQERIAARNRLLQMKLDVDPTARTKLNEELGRLYDVPRIREITGQIADLEIRPGEHIEQGDFVGHERAATTSFDHEILSSRPEPRGRRTDRRDTRDAGRERAVEGPAERGLPRRLPRSAAK